MEHRRTRPGPSRTLSRQRKAPGYDKRAKSEARFEKNARLLKEYRTAMKKEGFDVGKGASRKRNRDAKEDDEEQEKKKNEAERTCVHPEKSGKHERVLEGAENSYSGDSHHPSKKTRRKPKKSDPFRAAKKAANSRRLEVEEEQHRREEEAAKGERKRVEKARDIKKTSAEDKEGAASHEKCSGEPVREN
eukprot:CAMPEP_0194265264 /NCGR_PEP_ID=MMETSP0169-20130528/576_1 /TAXON_ID=218684 /ORGANISM="Corethron pennatum, Strain L29A3" /LENGTH=189 /DNA_ID=CAMNT_0039005695 /DNA_START=35 /DNA_END=603 /DNA_ORIENTATION=+